MKLIIEIGKRSILVSIFLILAWTLANAIFWEKELSVSPAGNIEVIDDSYQMDLSQDDINPVFKKEVLPQDIINKITGVSWQKEAPVGLEDLSYLTITYWDFDEKEQLGELIVHRKVAQEVLEIFEEIYNAKYPIAKMRLVDEYNADDNLSMEDNNTHAFNYRMVEGTQVTSTHGYGLAIDINPVQNPYIVGDIVLPSEGKKYLQRKDIRKGMIVKGDAYYNAFISRGWTWGGDWTRIKDYHHFEKDMD